MKAMRWFGTWALLAALGVGMAWLYVQAWDAEWDARMEKMRERGLVVEPWEKPSGFIDAARGKR